MRKLTIFLIILLAIVHQDFWLWNDSSLVFEFMPIGLAYHALYSLACGIVWALAVKFLWPSQMISQADPECMNEPTAKDHDLG